MAQIDTRHDERYWLFKLLVARETGDLDTVIEGLMAKMEKTDVTEVEERFTSWKNRREK